MKNGKTQCPKCGATLGTFEQRAHDQLHERAEKSTSLYERAWVEAELQLDRLERELDGKIYELNQFQRLMEDKGNLDIDGYPMEPKSSVAAPSNKKPAKKKTASKPKTAAVAGSKKRPPQPADKPYWDSKHGRWTDNPKYAPGGVGTGNSKADKGLDRTAPKKKPKAKGAKGGPDLSRLDAAGNGDTEAGES